MSITEVLDYSDWPSGNRPLADCAYGETEGCDTPRLLAGAERVLGQPVAAFAGCYEASTFVVGNEDLSRGPAVVQRDAKG